MNYYEQLNIDRGLNDIEIVGILGKKHNDALQKLNRAYENGVRKQCARRELDIIQQALNILGDTQKRRAYDCQLDNSKNNSMINISKEESTEEKSKDKAEQMHRIYERRNPKAESLFKEGMRYFNGDGIRQDYEKAISLLLDAANQNSADAQNQIAKFYYKGFGVLQSYDKAAEWYLKSAEQGNARAQCILGYLYYKGQGVSQL